MTIGDPKCKFNAHDVYLRCAVNPDGPCAGCTSFESVEVRGQKIINNGQRIIEVIERGVKIIYNLIDPLIRLLGITAAASLLFYFLYPKSHQYSVTMWVKTFKGFITMTAFFDISVCYFKTIQLSVPRVSIYKAGTLYILQICLWVLIINSLILKG